MPASSSRFTLALLIAVGLLPFVYLLAIPPDTADAVFWIARADPSDPDWLAWTFGQRHFRVTLRPATALSFTATWLVSGPNPWGHRLFDLLLHGSVVGLTYAVVRRWSTNPSPWAAWTAALVVAAHPLALFVLVDLARRSYTLASVFVLLAVLVCPRNDAPPDRRRTLGLAAAGLSALAALAHEGGYVAFVLCTVLVVPPMERLVTPAAWREALGRHRWLLGGSLGLGVVLMAWRTLVFAGVGGYRRGTPAPLATLQATLEGLFPVLDPSLGPARTWISLGWATVVLGAVGIALATNRARDPVTRVAAVWLLGLLCLFLPQPVWFMRQVYLLVPPLALLVGTLWGRNHLFTAAATVTPVLLGLLVPLHLGLAGDERARALAVSQLATKIERAARKTPKGGRLLVVAPYWRGPLVAVRPERRSTPTKRVQSLPNSARAPLLWVSEVVVPDRRLVLGLLGFTTVHETPPIWEIEREGRELRVVSTAARRLEGPSTNDLWTVDGTTATVDLSGDEKPLHVLVHDGATSQVWIVDP